MSETIKLDVTIEGDQNIVVGKGDVIINPLPPAEVRTRAHLGILLKNVETFWIKGVLEKSVHNAVLLDLGKEVRAEAVDHPWDIVLGRPDEPDQPLPAGTKISDIFAETPLLLILGEPGSGKTITLLELARDLIARVRVDPTFAQPIPVVFNLSTWIDKRQPLGDWVVEELRSKYRTSRRLGRTWLEQRRILPLLDGLDEVKRENRAACVEAINQFSVDYGLQGLAVCSRIKDYTALPVRLKFYGAVYIQPLTADQIDEYLMGVGVELLAVRKTLEHDMTFQQLAESPLMLNIMTLAYEGIPVQDLQAFDTVEARRKHLFDFYIERMFKPPGAEKRYSPEQTIRRLAWLAQKMSQHTQSVFLIEQMQPSWLRVGIQKWSYAVIFAVTAGLGIGLGMALGFGMGVKLTSVLITGLIGALAIALDAGKDIHPVEALEWSWAAAGKIWLLVLLVY